MRFKHSLQVFIDNIASTYKLLIYRLLVIAITIGLGCAVIIPSIHSVSSTQQYSELSNAVKTFLTNLSHLNLNNLGSDLDSVMNALGGFKTLIIQNGLIAIDIICLVVIAFIYYFLASLGDFAMGEVLNNRMTLRAHTPYAATFLKDLKRASLYSIIYTPISLLFYAVGGVIIWAIAFLALGHTPLLLKLFITSALIILLLSVKFSATCDWLPSILHSKLNNRKALAYALKPKKRNLWRVLSTAIYMMIIIITLNVVIALITFGAGLIITIPAGAMLLICYQFVNYCDNNELKYFVDDYVIIGPQKDTPVTREQFFKGEK